MWACSNIFSIDFLLFLHSLGLCCAQPRRWRRRGCGRGERKWHNQCRQKNSVIIMMEKKRISQCGRDLSDSLALRWCLNRFFTLYYVNVQWRFWKEHRNKSFVLNFCKILWLEKAQLSTVWSCLRKRGCFWAPTTIIYTHTRTDDDLCSAESCTLEVCEP